MSLSDAVANLTLLVHLAEKVEAELHGRLSGHQRLLWHYGDNVFSAHLLEQGSSLVIDLSTLIYGGEPLTEYDGRFIQKKYVTFSFDSGKFLWDQEEVDFATTVSRIVTTLTSPTI